MACYYEVMPNYRRAFVPGGTYFFTLVTCNRAPIFGSDLGRTILGNVFRDCLAEWPFTLTAIVLLPDHLHAIWTLPPGDGNYAARWSRIKKEFTSQWLAAGGDEQPIAPAMVREHRRGVWQKRYWEHTLEDMDDFEAHSAYIHFNPVKHGYVACPHEWPYSSFHRWVARGVYLQDWACVGRSRPDFSRVENRVGEP